MTGNKTYSLALIAAGLALDAFVFRVIGIHQMLEIAFAAIAIASTRAGVKKIEVAANLIPPTWLSKMGGFLPGVKTHLATMFLILTAVLAFLSGNQGLFLTIIIITAALGISALRVAIKRVHDFITSRL